MRVYVDKYVHTYISSIFVVFRVWYKLSFERDFIRENLYPVSDYIPSRVWFGMSYNVLRFSHGFNDDRLISSGNNVTVIAVPVKNVM